VTSSAPSPGSSIGADVSCEQKVGVALRAAPRAGALRARTRGPEDRAHLNSGDFVTELVKLVTRTGALSYCRPPVTPPDRLAPPLEATS